MSSAPEKSIVPPRRGRARARTGARDVLDRIDRQILKRLQENGRLSISQIASEVHLTVAPCCERVRRLEAAGYITGYFAQLDPQRLGLGLLAYVVVDIDRTAPEVFSEFAAAMRALDEVLECHMIGGGFDYLLKIRVRDMHAFRRFLGEKLGSVSGVQHTHTYFVMEEAKASHRLAVPG